MRKLFTTCLMAALAAALGCGSEHPVGGPGAGGTGTRTVTGKPKNDTFDINAPKLSTGIKQGEHKEVTISVDRSKDFKQDVTLKFSSEDKGVTVTPSTHTVKASDSETSVKVTVAASKDAAVAEHVIQVTGTPTEGASTSATFKVDVKGS